MSLKLSLIAIFFFTTQTLVLQAKPVNKWHTLYGNQTIFVDPDYKYNWHKAWNECALRNMSLMAVDSIEKSDALTELLKRVLGRPLNIWLGGHDLAEEGTFVWSASGKRFEFTNWFGRNPDNLWNVEHCVHIWESSDYEWNDATCVQKMGLICEAKPEHQVSCSTP